MIRDNCKVVNFRRRGSDSYNKNKKYILLADNINYYYVPENGTFKLGFRSARDVEKCRISIRACSDDEKYRSNQNYLKIVNATISDNGDCIIDEGRIILSDLKEDTYYIIKGEVKSSDATSVQVYFDKI